MKKLLILLISIITIGTLALAGCDQNKNGNAISPANDKSYDVVLDEQPASDGEPDKNKNHDQPDLPDENEDDGKPCPHCKHRNPHGRHKPTPEPCPMPRHPR